MATFGSFAGLATAALSVFWTENNNWSLKLPMMDSEHLDVLPLPSSLQIAGTLQHNLMKDSSSSSSSSSSPPPCSGMNKGSAAPPIRCKNGASSFMLAPQFDGLFCFETLVPR